MIYSIIFLGEKMNYPNYIKKDKSSTINYANRGMALENDLNITNKYYQEKNIAIINKKATPIQVVKVSFNLKKQPTIKEAYFKTPSTTDYNGLYRGKYLDFEAKETKNKKYFPLNNINKQQLKHIKNIINHQGICFIIVRFTFYNKTYLLKGSTLLKFITTNQKKSIPLIFFEENGYLIKETYLPRIDYLKIVDQIYFGGSNEKKDKGDSF